MKLNDLPGSVEAWVCGHVVRKERPVRMVSFRDGVRLSCFESDHGAWGHKDSITTTKEALTDFFPWLGSLEVGAGVTLIRETETSPWTRLADSVPTLTFASVEAYEEENRDYWRQAASPREVIHDLQAWARSRSSVEEGY